MNNTNRNNTHRRWQLSTLAFSLVVTFCTAEALVPHPTAFFSVRGGESRVVDSNKDFAFRGTSLNGFMGEETAQEEQAPNGASSAKPVKQIRVTAKSGLAATRMPPKKIANGNGNKQNGFPDANGNVARSKIAKLTEVEDRPIPAEFIAETALPTDVGQFRLRAYRTALIEGANEYVGREPSVIYAADKSPFGVEGELNQDVPIRIHDQCLTSEVFRSKR